MTFKQRPPEDAEPIGIWEWVSGGLFAAAIGVAIYTWLAGAL